MTIEEALRRSNNVDVTCIRSSCGAVTRIDLRFFASRRPLDTNLDDLARTLVCTACGGEQVILRVAPR